MFISSIIIIIIIKLGLGINIWGKTTVYEDFVTFLYNF